MSRRMRFALIVSAVVIVVGGAIAMAAVRMSGESDSAKGLERSGLAKNEVQGVESADESSTKASPFGEDVAAEGDGPGVAANEAYALNAYPADTIPFNATQSSIQAWSSIQGKGVGKGKNTPGQWALVGPSNASFPAELTFSGAKYTTSGRITGLAVDPNCNQSKCRVWAAAAGGGIWRTDKATSGSGVSWTYVSGTFGTNAIGTIYVDPTDPSGNTLYAGTGEPNASGDSGAGLGVYKTTDGGNTWNHLSSTVTGLTTPGNGTYTGDAFAGRSIAGIAVDPTNPNVIYVASTRGVHGVASVTAGATTNPPTPRPPFGLFKSTDGGATYSFIWDGNGSIRGVPSLALDPSNPNIVYASAFDQGTWRSLNGGTTWSQIKAPLGAGDPDRPSFAVTKLPNGNTRMYLGEGIAGSPPARFFRTDDASGAAVFTDMTTAQNINYCTGQCWYDNVVYTPPGKPDVVYLGGSYDYGNYGAGNNGRAFLRSTDGGATFTDQTWDATTGGTPPGSCCQPNPIAPNGMHPDQHAVVELPGTNSAIYGSDGGLVRSDGSFSDISSQCAARGLSGASLTLCQGLLSSVPNRLFDLNKGLSTLQFQSVRIDPANPNHLQGGTQDNGTFETMGSAVVWPQIMYGDGGQSGFSATNSALRFNTFTGQANDVNFQNGDPSKWVIVGGPMENSPEGAYFYPPVISDPVAGGTIFQGSFSVWRTQDWGGNQAYLEANCPEFTTSAANPNCGDFVRMGAPGQTDLTGGFYGGTRAGGAVSAIARTPADTGTVWAATGAGRVFISKNGDAPAGSVLWTRLDSKPLATASPGRAVSGIYVDPANPNHAYISYFGYNFNTPAQPGHVFSVTYNPGAGTAVWTSLDNPGGTPFPDFPANDVVYDSVTGDLYAANDFGVMRLASGSTSWTVAGAGMPMVEVSGLSIDPNSRELIAATHGRSAWKLTLP